MSSQIALKVHDKDNVATIFAKAVAEGMTVAVRDTHGNTEDMTVLAAIPYGHKIAVRDIAAGEEFIKYGEAIGVATRAIARGEHVHVHNLDSQRGRGDLAQCKSGA